MENKKEVFPSFEKKQSTQIQQNFDRQKELQLASYKQDARRTALQLSERCSQSADGGKADVNTILSNAELMYQWLINSDNEDLSKMLLNFTQTGVMEFKSPPVVS